MSRSRTVVVLAWVVSTAAALGLLSRRLPPDGFTSGDAGVKLIAAREAAAHPSRPLTIPLPRLDLQPVPFVDPLFSVHGDHAHALQAPFFPLLTAPLVAWLGLRGAYLLPAIAFVALLPLGVALVRRAGIAAGVHAIGIATVIASPVLFYAFEIWDHVPAIAVLGAATWLVAGEDRTARAWWPIGLAGALAAAGVLLRPEGVWYVAALGATFVAGRGLTHLGVFVAGGAVVLSAFVAANVAEGGPWLGHHAAANLSAMSDRWLEVRLARARLWLFPAAPGFVVGVAVLAGAWVVRWRDADVRRARIVGLGGAAVLAATAATGAFGADALWSAWPLGALALVPATSTPALRRLRWLAGLTMLGVWLTSTHDGGAQWGPRILLIATPALGVLAAAALQEAIGPGAARQLRLALVATIVMAGAWTSRRVVLDLRGTKRYHARLVAALDRNLPRGGYVVSNLAWVDQLAAPFYGTRTWLVAAPPASPADLLGRLERAGVTAITLVWSRDPAEPGPLPLGASCYRLRRVVEVPERMISIGDAECVTGGERP